MQKETNRRKQPEPAATISKTETAQQKQTADRGLFIFAVDNGFGGTADWVLANTPLAGLPSLLPLPASIDVAVATQAAIFKFITISIRLRHYFILFCSRVSV